MILRLPDTVLFSSTAPAGMSILSAVWGCDIRPKCEPSRHSDHHCQPWGENRHTSRSCVGEQDCIWQPEDHGPLSYQSLHLLVKKIYNPGPLKCCSSFLVAVYFYFQNT